jgi:hypothetical protein
MFFGTSVSQVSHVGIDAGIQHGQPTMVDASHTGADVRVEPLLAADLSEPSRA